MPLNFDFADCKGGDEIWKHPFSNSHRHPVSVAIIEMSMFLGYSTINEGNVVEIARRFSMYQKVQGPLIRWSDETKKSDGGRVQEAYVTEDDIRLYIGFRCNSSTVSPKEWDKNFLAWVQREPQGNWPAGSAFDKYKTFATAFLKREKEEAKRKAK